MSQQEAHAYGEQSAIYILPKVLCQPKCNLPSYIVQKLFFVAKDKNV